MKEPGLPADERERLRELDALRILDTEEDAVLAGLVRVAARLFDTPMALITLVDAKRQWFLARTGVDATETPREISFCGHVVASAQDLVVGDALEDDRFYDNPLVTGPMGVRFYAAVPLRTPRGHDLGTLCVLDRRARQLPQQGLDDLRALAAAVVEHLELRRLGFELRRERDVLVATRNTLAARDQWKRVVLDSMAEGVLELDSEGTIVGCNPAAERIFGLSCGQLRGRVTGDRRWDPRRPDGTSIPPEDLPASICMRTGKPVRRRVLHLARPTGERVWIEASAEPLMSEGARGVVVNLRDITERRAQQRALEQAREHAARSQRLATVGRLAAGVSHEINSPLTALMGNLDLISDDALSEEAREMVAEAREAAACIDVIVQRMHRLDPEDAPHELLDPALLVHAACEFVSSELKGAATLELELEAVRAVEAVSERLVGAIAHLLSNAARSFRTRNPRANLVRVRLFEERARVVITVQDNGPGIVAEHLPRIFDPFSLRRPVGVAIGLGLASAYSTITSIGGELSVSSTPGEGACFRIVLPTSGSTPV